jgi:hypothetical protein
VARYIKRLKTPGLDQRFPKCVSPARPQDECEKLRIVILMNNDRKPPMKPFSDRFNDDKRLRNRVRGEELVTSRFRGTQTIR